MKELLIINVNIVGNNPQPIRIRNLVHEWQKSALITLVTMDNYGDEDLFPGENVTVVRTPFSRLGNVMISKNIIASKEYVEAKKTLKRRSRDIVRKAWRASIFYRLLFPDRYITELGNIVKQAGRLKKEGRNFDIVLISAAPFSLMKLGKKMKEFYPSATIMYDTGDPFYGNTTLLLVKPLRTVFAKRFERRNLAAYDLLVVPTQVLKDHYINYFGDVIDPSRIRVIEQGIEPAFSKISPKENLKSGEIRLMYAGGLYKNLREPFELYKAIEQYRACDLKLRIFGNIYQDFLPAPGEHFYYGGSMGSEELLAEYNDCDATVFIDNLSGIQIPGKVIELLSIKRPILFIKGNPDSPTIPLVMGNHSVIMCENNALAICEGIDRLRESYGSFTYDDLPVNYFWPALAEKYLGDYL
jgi:hypothetical protein